MLHSSCTSEIERLNVSLLPYANITLSILYFTMDATTVQFMNSLIKFIEIYLTLHFNSYRIMHWKSLLQWRILWRKFVCSSMSVSIWILGRRLLSELVRLLYCDEYIYNCIAMDIKSTRPMCNLAFLIICFPTLVSFFLPFKIFDIKFQVPSTIDAGIFFVGFVVLPL